MTQVEISEEMINKVRAFKKVIDAVLGKKLPSESHYIELVTDIGLERMLLDITPKEESHQKTIMAMFRDNPEYVADFVARMIKGGEIIKKEEESKAKEAWSVYIQ